MCDTWATGEIRALPLEHLGERYRRYRLTSKEAEQEMARSLSRYGQLSPIVVFVREQQPQVLDGFKRLRAARAIDGMKTLSAHRLDVDERGAKAAIYGLNQIGRHLKELEEAWIVFALVREKEEYILSRPREALRQSQGYALPSWDPRLSPAGNRTSKQLGGLLDGLSRMENWLVHRGRADLSACDRRVLRPAFAKLSGQCLVVAELAEELLQAMPES